MKSRKTILKAARLALFAMLLIVFAPLVSIMLQKASGSPVQVMMHHDMSMMPMAEHHGNHAGVDAHTGEHPQKQTLSKQHQDALMLMEHAGACGYCVLLAQVPGLLLLLTLVLPGGNLWLQRIRIAAPVVSLWLFIPWLYPHTRAPPRHPAFSY